MSEKALADLSISPETPETIQALVESLRAFDSSADVALVEKAYLFSERVHAGQFRRSGEPYIFHPLGVAAILADLHLDVSSIVTGLLHDTVEDTCATLEEIEADFGKTVAELVDGVTKISRINFRSTHEKQGENIRKMIVAMGKDVRVVLVKLADRLHNMRTLHHMPYEKQSLIAQETLDIYAPLAGRLGMMSMKIELEDTSFRYANPDIYYQLASQVASRKGERERYIEDTKKLLAAELAAKSSAQLEVSGRPKHLFSIWKKMQMRQAEYEQIHDVLAFRVLVDTISECYEILGHVHSLWKPIPGRFKDFIAMPKANRYQSLHTTVIGPGGERIEIQIRTREMHMIAERGIAAHWKYKEGGKAQAATEQKFEWLRDLVALHQTVRNPDEFLETVKSDLFEREIYVFTPKGDVRELPDGATPIDFAYAVHTDLGHRCAAARVNGKLVPLRTPLRNGDTIEIISSAQQKPSKDWLKMCVTTRAKSKIRWWVKNEERKQALALGEELLDREFKKAGLSKDRYLRASTELDNALKRMKLQDLDELRILIGYGKLVASEVLLTFEPSLKAPPPVVDTESSEIGRVVHQQKRKEGKAQSIIRVDGLDDLLVRFGKCCNPIPGDPICGFITRGRGITVHRVDCEKAFDLANERRVDVEWSVNEVPVGVDRHVRVRVISQDMPGLLKSMSEAFTGRGVNIMNAQIRTTKDRKAICQFEVSVRELGQLKTVMADLKRISGILDVSRV